MRQPDASRFEFGGVGISCTDMERALDALFRIAHERSGGYFAFTCAHGIVDSQKDERLRGILNSSRMTMPDGMPTVWLGRARGCNVRRVTAPDFFEAAMRDPRAKGLRHYFYGASPEAIERIAARARELVGVEAVAGAMSPPLRAAGAMEDADVIADIARREPHLIWVGLGLPKQEYWMANHARLLPYSLMLGVGAAFDWFAGTQPRAPRVLQALGLEWAHRVASEPARLWPRYRAVVPAALRILARELTGLRGAPPAA
ncbi:MAG TPA: WecB/TagA/CpsF family glycosyltransferase [Usitatibacter sp.]|nr:WecB/TagA/CpsF family glycosyltransferase [Usitatibacter sp.]